MPIISLHLPKEYLCRFRYRRLPCIVTLACNMQPLAAVQRTIGAVQVSPREAGMNRIEMEAGPRK